MRHIPEPPTTIKGEAYDYLYKLCEMINLALEDNSGSVATGGTKTTIAAGYDKAQDKTAADLKALIIKTAEAKSEADTAQQTAERAQQEAAAAATTADMELLKKTIVEVNATISELSAKLSGEYVAASDFGKYVEKLNSEIVATPENVTQYYSFYSWLQTELDSVNTGFTDYKTTTEGYVRTGIVYYNGTVPVYGVAVGQNLTAHEIDGEQVVDQTNFRATFTANKLSFWQGEYEMGYFSNTGLHTGDLFVDGNIEIGGKWRWDRSSGLALKWIGG